MKNKTERNIICKSREELTRGLECMAVLQKESKASSPNSHSTTQMSPQTIMHRLETINHHFVKADELLGYLVE